jgi:hypothetical protein
MGSVCHARYPFARFYKISQYHHKDNQLLEEIVATLKVFSSYVITLPNLLNSMEVM